MAAGACQYSHYGQRFPGPGLLRRYHVSPAGTGAEEKAIRSFLHPPAFPGCP
jgi:hypothetical protein